LLNLNENGHNEVYATIANLIEGFWVTPKPSITISKLKHGLNYHIFTILEGDPT